MNTKPARRPSVQRWGEVRRIRKVFPGADIYFDLQDIDGNRLDSAAVMAGETPRTFAGRVALDYEHRTGKPLPPGCRLIYSETFG